VENRFRNIFLVVLILMYTPSVLSQTTEQTPVADAPEATDISGSGDTIDVTEISEDDEEESSLIEPQIERVEFDESLIDADDFQISLFFGMLSIEDFGTNSVAGFKLAYHVNEDFYVEAEYGESDAGETSFEVLNAGAPLLSDEERSLNYYQLNVGYNVFPGEAFVTDNTTINNAFYLVFGIGNSEFAGDDRFTFNYGFGYRLLFWDTFSFSADMRDYVFDLDVFGEEEEINNLAYTMSLSWYF